LRIIRGSQDSDVELTYRVWILAIHFQIHPIQ
jgi:hypothetical protein